MTAVALFLEAHARLHTAEVARPAEGGSYEEGALRGLSPADLRLVPRPGVNSLAWLLWHMARAEDLVASRLATGGPELLHAEGWLDRLGVSRRDIGTGMTPGEVAELSAGIDLDALRGYRTRVGRRTREVVVALAPGEWEAPIGDAALEQAAAEGVFAPGAEWVARAFRGRSKGGLLTSIAVLHTAMHLGEVGTVRAVAGLGAGR